MDQRLFVNGCWLCMAMLHLQNTKQNICVSKWGTKSIKDDPARPAEVATQKICQKLKTLACKDKCLRVSCPESTVLELYVLTILHYHLGVSQISSHWVTRIRTSLQK
jgi:hypothetical protein